MLEASGISKRKELGCSRIDNITGEKESDDDQSMDSFIPLTSPYRSKSTKRSNEPVGIESDNQS